MQYLSYESSGCQAPSTAPRGHRTIKRPEFGARLKKWNDGYSALLMCLMHPGAAILEAAEATFAPPGSQVPPFPKLSVIGRKGTYWCASYSEQETSTALSASY